MCHFLSFNRHRVALLVWDEETKSEPIWEREQHRLIQQGTHTITAKMQIRAVNSFLHVAEVSYKIQKEISVWGLGLNLCDELTVIWGRSKLPGRSSESRLTRAQERIEKPTIQCFLNLSGSVLREWQTRQEDPVLADW